MYVHRDTRTTRYNNHAAFLGAGATAAAAASPLSLSTVIPFVAVVAFAAGKAAADGTNERWAYTL